MSRVLASIAVAVNLGMYAAADQTSEITQAGEALAWTVAAYGTCEDEDQLQREFKREAAVLKSDFNAILSALAILEETDTVCEVKATFASDMRRLATTDMSSFEAKLMTFGDPAVPVFQEEQPEGAGESQTSVILEAASNPPPLSSGAPSQGSDYQN